MSEPETPSVGHDQRASKKELQYTPHGHASGAAYAVARSPCV